MPEALLPENLLTEPHGPVLLIRLNRPEALNALNLAVMRELAEVLGQADKDPEVRCIVLTGRMMDAVEAERAGLVARIFPAADLMAEALKTTQAIAEKPVLAVMATKEAVNAALETTLSTGLAQERRLFQALFATEDQKEGMAAFLAKRPAKFIDK